MENIGEKRMDMISKWEEKSRDFIDAFLLLFGREGRLVYILIHVCILYTDILKFFICSQQFGTKVKAVWCKHYLHQQAQKGMAVQIAVTAVTMMKIRQGTFLNIYYKIHIYFYDTLIKLFYTSYII